MSNAQTEIERLREENAALRQQLSQQHQLPTIAIPHKDAELVLTLTRFAEGLISEAAVRNLYRLTEEDWERLGSDDELVRAIDAEKIRRIRDGSFKRERSQQLIAEKGPSTLDKILSDERSNAKHKIDAVKALDDLAEGGPRATHDDSERVIVTIRLGKDEPPLVVDATVNPSPSNVIDATPTNPVSPRQHRR